MLQQGHRGGVLAEISRLSKCGSNDQPRGAGAMTLEPAVVAWLAAHRLTPLATRLAALATTLDDVAAVEAADLEPGKFKPLEQKRLLQAVAELRASVSLESGGGDGEQAVGSAARRLARIEETVERLDRNVQQIVGMLTKQRYQQREHDAHTAASRSRSWRATSMVSPPPQGWQPFPTPWPYPTSAAGLHHVGAAGGAQGRPPPAAAGPDARRRDRPGMERRCAAPDGHGSAPSWRRRGRGRAGIPLRVRQRVWRARARSAAAAAAGGYAGADGRASTTAGARARA